MTRCLKRGDRNATAKLQDEKSLIEETRKGCRSKDLFSVAMTTLSTDKSFMKKRFCQSFFVSLPLTHLFFPPSTSSSPSPDFPMKIYNLLHKNNFFRAFFSFTIRLFFCRRTKMKIFRCDLVFCARGECIWPGEPQERNKTCRRVYVFRSSLGIFPSALQIWFFYIYFFWLTFERQWQTPVPRLIKTHEVTVEFLLCFSKI